MAIPLAPAISAVTKAAEVATAVEMVEETVISTITDITYAVSEAIDIANEAWAGISANSIPVEIDAASEIETIAEEAWKAELPVEELDGRGTLENPRYIITRNELLADDFHPITGVAFIKKIVQLRDEVIEGVFPKFTSSFEAKLPDDLLMETDKNQFKECNRQLADQIDSNPDLKLQFTAEQIEQIYDGIEDGTSPDGYVWHHNEEAGVMQLVDAEVHAKTGHTGGKSIWGGGREYR